MNLQRVLVTSLLSAAVAVAFSAPVFAQSVNRYPVGVNPSLAGGGAANLSGTGTPAIGAPMFAGPPRGYPCTWSGSRNLARGETAYQHGSYDDAIAQWKTASSKDCAIAAYKLGMLYYGGNPQLAADRSLGAAWLRIATESRTNTNPYYQQMSRQAVANLSQPQRAQYVADYARLSATLGSSIAR